MSKKSSRRDEVGEHTVTFLKIVSRNVPGCISAHIHFKKFSLGEGGAPGSPYDARRLRLLRTSPLHDKS